MANKVNIDSLIVDLTEIAAICRTLAVTANQTPAALNVSDTVEVVKRLEQLAHGLFRPAPNVTTWDWFDAIGDQANKILSKLQASNPPTDQNKQDALKEIKKISDLVVTASMTATASPPALALASDAPSFAAPKAEFDKPAGAPPAETTTPSLRQFFQSISTSLLEAQTALNENSLDYVSGLDPRIPPAYYGIPSVKAEMHVGFNAVSQSGVNLILFNKSNTKEQYGESTISFELVGAPPPPGPTVYGNYVVPMPRFLVVGQKRSELIDKIDDKVKVGQKLQNTKRLAAVVRFEQTGDGANRYMVVWPGWSSKDDTPALHPMWEEISVFYIEEDQQGAISFPVAADTGSGPNSDKFQFPPLKGHSIFEHLTQDAGFSGGYWRLNGSTRKTLADNNSKDALAGMLVNLGDVLTNFFLMFNYWLDAVKYEPKVLPAPPPAG